MPSRDRDARSYDQGLRLLGGNTSSLPSNGVGLQGSSEPNFKIGSRRPKQRSQSIDGDQRPFTSLKQQSGSDLSTANLQHNIHLSTNTDASLSTSPKANKYRKYHSAPELIEGTPNLPDGIGGLDATNTCEIEQETWQASTYTENFRECDDWQAPIDANHMKLKPQAATAWQI